MRSEIVRCIRHWGMVALPLWAGGVAAAAEPKLDSRPSRIEALDQALADMEGRYDPVERMVKTPFHSPGYHTTLTGGIVRRTRESLTYAAACLDAGTPALRQRGFDIIDRVIELQDTDPDSRTYGIWSWFLEEPLDQMAPPDWNWADFCGVQLLQAVLYHRDEFPPELLARVERSIYHAAQSIRRRNVGPGYTNIAIMGTYVTMMTAHLQDLPELKEYARNRLRRFHDHTKITGAFQEYNSPTYTIVALKELSRMRQHVADEAAQVLVEELYRIAWEEIALHFHAPSRQWAGPHSRSYSTLLRNSTLSLLQSETGETVQFADIGTDKDLEARRLQCPCPPDLEHHFVEWTEPRQLVRTYSGGARPVIGTTYLGENFCLGTVNRGDLWNQRRSLVAYWGPPESPSYLRLRFLHDGYDFAAAQVFCAQDQGRVLAGVVLATNGGDTHVSLDRIQDATFTARDLRLRFEFGGNVTAASITMTDAVDEPIRVSVPGMNLLLGRLFARFDQADIHWESGAEDEKQFLDLVFYQGPERSFNLANIPHAAAAIAMAMDKPVRTSPVAEAGEHTDQLRVRWDDLSLSFQTRPDTTQNLLAAWE